MSVQQLITKGRKDIDDIDKTLARTERLVEDTRDVGKNVSRAAAHAATPLQRARARCQSYTHACARCMHDAT